jgi:hypothetical protein
MVFLIIEETIGFKSGQKDFTGMAVPFIFEIMNVNNSLDKSL